MVKLSFGKSIALDISGEINCVAPSFDSYFFALNYRTPSGECARSDSWSDLCDLSVLPIIGVSIVLASEFSPLPCENPQCKQDFVWKSGSISSGCDEIS
jgi:hypothetical protein